MTQAEHVALAKNIFEPDQHVIEIRYDARPDLIVIVEDAYGRVENRVIDGDWYDEAELRRSFESLKRGRTEDIGEWEHQKKLSAEIVDYLNGKADPTNRMRWLPKLVYHRFLEDFHLHFPELEKLIKNPSAARNQNVIDELSSIPFTWQKSP